MRISWQVPLPVKAPYLRVGPKPWELSRKIEAEVRDLHTPSLSKKLPAVEQYYLHAALDGLEPGTTYYYGVGHDGFDPASPERMATLGSFRTAPARAEKFVFTAFGDQGVSYHALANDQLILGQNPSFHLHAGDLCYADTTGHGEDSDTYDARVWDTFLAQTESVAKSVPWMVTTGNHDMEAWYSPNGYGGQSARWSLPENGFDPRRAPGVYSFTYGNVGVVALDANDVSYEIPANRATPTGSRPPGLTGGWASCGRTRTWTSSSSSSTTAPTRRRGTPPTAGCATRGCRCSPSTRWTWWSTATTTSTNAPTPSRAARSAGPCRSARRPIRRATASCTSPRAARARTSTNSAPGCGTATRATSTTATRSRPSTGRRHGGPTPRRPRGHGCATPVSRSSRWR